MELFARMIFWLEVSACSKFSSIWFCIHGSSLDSTCLTRKWQCCAIFCCVWGINTLYWSLYNIVAVLSCGIWDWWHEMESYFVTKQPQSPTTPIYLAHLCTCPSMYNGSWHCLLRKLVYQSREAISPCVKPKRNNTGVLQ